MSDENKYTIDDMINFAVQQKPVDVKSAFDDLMLAKIHSAIEDKKMEVAKQMFGSTESEEEIEAAEFEDEQDEMPEDETDTEESSDDDFDLDITDDELEALLSDLEDNLEDDNLDSEETEDGEEA